MSGAGDVSAGRRIRLPGRRALPPAAVAVFLLLFLFPLVWILSSSLKPLPEIMSGHPRILPQDPTLGNYLQLFRAATDVKDFGRFVRNGLKVALGTAALTVILATMGGYSLARYQYPGKVLLSRLMLFIYVFPAVPLLIPLYRVATQVKLLDTHLGLIIVYTAFTAPFSTWLLASFFRAIPSELEEAARVDGCGTVQAFTRVVVPLAVPGIVTAGVYALITAWGEYMFALVLLMSNAKKTPPLGLATYMTEQYIEWGPLSAGAVAVIVPVLILFYPMARSFIQGFMAGAVKG